MDISMRGRCFYRRVHSYTRFPSPLVDACGLKSPFLSVSEIVYSRRSFQLAAFYIHDPGILLLGIRFLAHLSSF